MISDRAITEEVNRFAEVELRKFQRVAEICNELVMITDSNGKIEYVNPALCRITGFKPEEIIGRQSSILKSNRMSALFYERLWNTITSGRVWQGEFFNKRHNGTYFLENAVISPVLAGDGSISHYIKVGHDITVRRQLEENQLTRMKLAESINSANLAFMKHEKLHEMATVIVETCMSITDSSFAILYEMLPDGNAGILALKVASTEEHSSVRQIQYEIMRNGQYEVKPHQSLLHAPISEGRTIVVNAAEENIWGGCLCPLCSIPLTTFAGFPLKTASATIGMIGIANAEGGYSPDLIHDIEEFTHSCSLALATARSEITRKSTLDQLRQSQKMEAIGQLAGGISHDFNNILTVISGFSSLALQKTGSGHPAAKDIENIINASERASALVRQLLAFGRRQIFNPFPLDVNNFINGLNNILSRLIGDNVKLNTIVAPQLSIVMADPTQMEQILINLVINARDAMIPNGGVITIKTQNQSIDAPFVRKNRGANVGDYVVISVSDTGVGMSDELISRIFEPFFTTKAGSGTGLGLSTVYGIVKQNNGYIKVQSEIGIGSEFRVFIPVYKSQTESPDHTTPKLKPFTSDIYEGLILVVEDDETVLELTAVSLRSQGFDVITASGPLEALSMFDRIGKKVCLLLSDVFMPDMSGIEMAQIMLKSNPQTRVLFMSGYSEDKIPTLEIPGVKLNLITKPFTPAELIFQVKTTLAGLAPCRGDKNSE